MRATILCTGELCGQLRWKRGAAVAPVGPPIVSSAKALPMQFGFPQLDELAFSAALNGKFRGPTNSFLPTKLGTLVELQWLLQTGLPLPKLEDLRETRRIQLVRAISMGQRTAAFEEKNNRARLINSFWNKDQEPDAWYNFCLSMQKAATAAKFPRKNAQELVAAMRELVSNIFDHSGATETGVAGFSLSGDEFEIVVADRGLGVLKSLRTSTEFCDLKNSGEALQAALTDGSSRFGKSSGHGAGFRDLFRGLLNLSSTLRFRSGDYALSINGISPGLAMARISKKVQLPGLVISIVCKV